MLQDNIRVTWWIKCPECGETEWWWILVEERTWCLLECLNCHHKEKRFK